ncbi:MAG TPA: hypothetical protein VFZ26_00595 [Gemmatimonadales bacterium]
MRGMVLGAMVLAAWTSVASAQRPCGAPQGGRGLFAGITLTETQQRQVDSIQAAHQPVREAMQASRKPGQGRDSAHIRVRTAMQEQMRQSYRAVLTPAQQEVFDSNAARMPRGGPGRPAGRQGTTQPCRVDPSAGPS